MSDETHLCIAGVVFPGYLALFFYFFQTGNNVVHTNQLVFYIPTMIISDNTTTCTFTDVNQINRIPFFINCPS